MRNDTNIDYIEIKKLHGTKNFTIDFENPFKIFVSENGQGKTTILKIINAILEGNAEKLRDVNFESIKIASSKKIFNITKEEIENNFYTEDSHHYKRAIKYLERRTTPKVLESIKAIALSSDNNSSTKRKILDISAEYNLNIAHAAIDDLIRGRKSALRPEIDFEEIKNIIKITPIYLPTYRRIEDDIVDSDIDEKTKAVLNKKNMFFGLSDTENRLSEIKRELLANAKNSTSKINAEILSKLVNQIKIEEIDKDIILKNSDKIELVLTRIGSEIPKTDKERIIELVGSTEIFRNQSYNFLLYFLSKMYEAFFEQENNDKALRKFAEVCSDYFKFSNKKMIYDDKELDINIVSTETKDTTIRFNQLSSGEKQIVSLFSKLYLEEDDNNYGILFDEPELSLSIEWQKKLLHDVINSGKCKLLIAMTHSPFIFKGLSNYTTDLRNNFTQQ